MRFSQLIDDMVPYFDVQRKFLNPLTHMSFTGDTVELHKFLGKVTPNKGGIGSLKLAHFIILGYTPNNIS